MCLTNTDGSWETLWIHNFQHIQVPSWRHHHQAPLEFVDKPGGISSSLLGSGVQEGWQSKPFASAQDRHMSIQAMMVRCVTCLNCGSAERPSVVFISSHCVGLYYGSAHAANALSVSNCCNGCQLHSIGTPSEVGAWKGPSRLPFCIFLFLKQFSQHLKPKLLDTATEKKDNHHQFV